MNEEMERLLAEAAALWVAAFPPDPGGAYSTVANLFLHRAEAAYFKALSDLPEATPPAHDLPQRGWVVYRLLDQLDRVLYVGMTGLPRVRIRAHLREFGDRITRVEWEPHASRVDAYDAETALIRELQPPMNLAKMGQS